VASNGPIVPGPDDEFGDRRLWNSGGVMISRGKPDSDENLHIITLFTTDYTWTALGLNLVTNHLSSNMVILRHYMEVSGQLHIAMCSSSNCLTEG
jgi:hypothetical protein